MERKNNSTVVVASTQEVKAALTQVTTLHAEEERALRMRHGATVETIAPLAQKAPAGSDLADELLMMEMAMFRAVRARAALKTRTEFRNPVKEKIVRALRKKK